ncbi:malto-oligosyltrehalose trehalohydrolase [Jannaschia sp. S6380]|uniref:malto-oligosyltrehalose trehalohydrolase n=1 Tax=Jannaschia sp. S6380 TaxID=2926408 RepID=UPI001FF119A8|nr:malto-oligosyltrehalose trehalohydrolase [Jannaschia sp. S6380]MCK0168464.1 malto-oligosyltrehalose trehalohydrolase [Jannaschia sp. S6380]
MTDKEAPLPQWGAVPVEGGTRFRLWAPGVATVTLSLPDGDVAMTPAGDGWFERIADAPPGTPYRFRMPDGMQVPDPASRLQAGDVHGDSVVADATYDWVHDHPDRSWAEAVIYECHIGTFTEDGTYRAAIDRLDHLADLGITVLEILPVAQFGGDHGWGYDGVLPYAPHPAYGTPDDLRALVDAAHGRGMLVLLDVVYNHFGPDGNYLNAYAPDFFDPDRHTPWGAAIDYTRDPVRRFFLDNALMWLRDYRFDGLRLDAIDHIRDPSDPELLVQLAREVRTLPHSVHLTTEDNRNVTHLHEGPNAMAGEWNDDWHNAAHVVLTGETEGYYDAYADAPVRMLAQAAAQGFTTKGAGGQGVDSAHQPPTRFIDFLQNHDQTGNRARGDRLTTLAHPDALAAAQALLLLQPHIPMLFQGEEWGETRPFLFFADFDGDLAHAVTRGRRSEFEGFKGFTANDVPDPIARATFEASKLDWSARDTPAGRDTLARMRDLLALRAREIIPHLGDAPGHSGTVQPAPEGCVAVDWALDGARLRIRANFGNAVWERADLPEGDPLHLTGEEIGHPRSCAAWIER